MKYFLRIILSFFVIFNSGCSTSDSALQELALSEAGENAKEICKFIDRYNGEKGDAAASLVRGMIGRYSLCGEGIDSIESLYHQLPHPNGSWQFDSLQLVAGRRYELIPHRNTSDLQVLTADYLINNFEDAWMYKEKRIWNRSLSVSDFSEFLLPYRIGNEPVTEWRVEYRAAYDSLSGKIDAAFGSVAAAAIISEALGDVHYNNNLRNPHRPATGLLSAPVGYCRDDCDRIAYAMRAFGVPVTIDEILVSPDNGTSHQWCMVLDTEDNTFRMFDNSRFPPTRDSVHYDGRRKGKVYRRTWEINTDRVSKLSSIPDVPAELLNPRFRDVTADYFGHNEASVRTGEKSGTVFLGVFSPEGYRPIDVAENTAYGNAVFRDIEPDLIYFPVTFDGGGCRTCGNPFMLKSDGNVHEFIPDISRMESLTMKRKMPFWLHHPGQMRSVIGIRMQVGLTADGPWRDVDSIYTMPLHSFYRIPVSMGSNERYIRLQPSPMRCSEIGEVMATADSLALQRLPLSVITENLSAEEKNLLVDGDILTWISCKPEYGDIIFRIDSDRIVNSIFLIPRNDDNYVVPGEEYELFYFDRNEWKSLGKKTAEGFDITYDVPANAVLWLRNLTKGKEEQIFICRDGRQLFNADLGVARLELND